MMIALRSRLAERRAARTKPGNDDGMVLIMCLVFIVFGSLIIAPLLSYAAQTLRTSHIQTEKSNRAEAVRGALRIALAESVQQAVMLELQASGGRAYLVDRDRSFARRWRESAFIPIVTPSLTQLQVELAKHAAA